MDKFDKATRSWIMGRIKNKETSPEVAVRSIVYNLGYRYRINRADLPGNPDIVLPKYHKIIFVHGCFWHGHKKCSRATRPNTNKDFWNKKLDVNIIRDNKNIKLLRELGWDVLVIWQCQIKDEQRVRILLKNFLIN